MVGHIDDAIMLVSKLLVLESDRGPSDSVEIGAVSYRSGRIGLERPEDIDFVRALRQDDGNLHLVSHGTREVGHNRYLQVVLALASIILDAVSEGTVPTKSKAVVPSTHDRVAGLHLQNTVLILVGKVFGQGSWGRDSAKLGGGDVTNKVVVISIMNACGEVEGKACDDVWGGALEVGM